MSNRITADQRALAVLRDRRPIIIVVTPLPTIKALDFAVPYEVYDRIEAEASMEALGITPPLSHYRAVERVAPDYEWLYGDDMDDWYAQTTAGYHF